MRKRSISEALQNIQPQYVEEAAAYAGKAGASRPAWVKWGVAAACLALIAVLGLGTLPGGWFGAGGQTAVLDTGERIRFVRSDGGAAQPDIAVDLRTRPLTNAEVTELFGDLPVDGYALFGREDDRILGVEGHYGAMRLFAAAPGVNGSDTVLEGEETASEVDGIPVCAGYFTSGGRVVYYATLTLGETTVYIENAGEKALRETVRNETASAIQALVRLKALDLDRIAP